MTQITHDNCVMFCPDPIAWSAVAPWVGALGTWFAGLVAVGTLIFGGWRWFRVRQFEQAEQVYGWIHRDQATDETRVGNGSKQPVYNVMAYWGPYESLDKRVADGGQRADEVCAVVSVLPPGDYRLSRQPPSIRAGRTRMYSSPVEIVFSDAAGRHWVRRFNGKLERIESSPLREDYFAKMGLFDARSDIAPLSDS